MQVPAVVLQTVQLLSLLLSIVLFFFNDTATTEIYTLSLHDALPICFGDASGLRAVDTPCGRIGTLICWESRSEEHTSELQSHSDLVCRLLLEKKKEKLRLGDGQIEQHRLVSHSL